MCQKEEEDWKLGLHWLQLDEKPEKGGELVCAALGESLERGQTSFERAEIDSFKVEGLAWSSFVRVCDLWFGPTGRSPVETNTFRHALTSLDVIYAHKAMASLLSTRLPSGVQLDRG